MNSWVRKVINKTPVNDRLSQINQLVHDWYHLCDPEAREITAEECNLLCAHWGYDQKFKNTSIGYRPVDWLA